MHKLLKVFKVESNFQLAIVFFVFSITGSTALIVAGPFLEAAGIQKESIDPIFFWPLRIVIIFPIYQVLLVIIGTLVGQRHYFWQFEKRFLSRLGIRFPEKKSDTL